MLKFNFFSPPAKRRVAERFILEYARLLRDELNAFTESSIHQATGYISLKKAQVIIHIQPESIPGPISLQRVNSIPKQPTQIAFTTDLVFITKPAATMAHLQKWSNVAAWEDSNDIIAQILNAAANAKSKRSPS